LNREKQFYKKGNYMRYDEIRKIEELSEYILDKYDVKVPITNIEKLVEKMGGTVV